MKRVKKRRELKEEVENAGEEEIRIENRGRRTNVIGQGRKLKENGQWLSDAMPTEL